MQRTRILVRILFLAFAIMLSATLITYSAGLQGEYEKFTFSGLLEFLSTIPDLPTFVIPYREWLNNIDNVHLGNMLSWALAFFVEPINALLWFCTNILNVIKYVMAILDYILYTV